MDYKQLNKWLSDLRVLRGNKVETQVIHEVPESSSQGDEGLSYEVCRVPGEKDIFIKLQITTDSYGDNESITGVEFVKPVEKTVTNYQPL